MGYVPGKIRFNLPNEQFQAYNDDVPISAGLPSFGFSSQVCVTESGNASSSGMLGNYSYGDSLIILLLLLMLCMQLFRLVMALFTGSKAMWDKNF